LKSGALIVFFTIVSVVYGLLNFYIYSRAVHLLPAGSSARVWFTVIFWILVSSFILARILERACPCDFTEVITWIGSFYLGIMVYALLAVIAGDLARLLNHFFHFFPDFLSREPEKTRLIIFLGSLGLIILIVAAGFINARIPKIRQLEITINKSVKGDKTLKIVMASDIHMGTLIAKRRTNYLVRKINELDPDLILFAGDIVDEDLSPVIRRNLGATLGQLKARYGIYGITGNHEYIGGVEPAVKYLSEHGITMLRDTAILVNDYFYLAGRDDRDKPRFTGRKRKDLKEIMENVDRSYPVILMDHQPFNLEKAVELGIDLQFSGHTHHGQMWPFNYITSAIYEISTGYRQIGNTHFYVSSGFGSWGPPIRTGNRPEIVVVTVNFK
jgi:uncharacterized protein